MLLRSLSVCFAVFGISAQAEPIRVVTDIAPVHSLVAQVMGETGTPELLLPQNASPHGYSMRPSEARALQSADLVIWVGPELTPWLENAVDTLAKDAHQVHLLDVEGATRFEFRDVAVFGGDEEHHDHEDHGDHEAHDDHEAHAADEGHDDHKAHDDHAGHDDHEGHDDNKADDGHAGHDDHEGHDDQAGHDDHDHAGGTDPHVWLDPVNAQFWLSAIAEELAEIDPDNAATYRANAQAARERLDGVIATLEAQLHPVEDAPFLVYHDAYQYFERRFGMRVVGAIAASDAAQPSPARLAELRDEIAETAAKCVFHEPQFSTRLVNALADGTDLRTAMLDPIGSEVPLGADLYQTVVLRIGDAMSACLSAKD